MDIYFYIHFQDENNCRLHFKFLRDKIGVICKKCDGNSHYWLKNKWAYECKNCKFRTSLRNGTIMENSKLPFLVWYKTIFLLSITEKKIPAIKIHKLLCTKSYHPIWNIVKVIKKRISPLNNQYTLEKIVKENRDYFNIELNYFNEYKLDFRYRANDNSNSRKKIDINPTFFFKAFTESQNSHKSILNISEFVNIDFNLISSITLDIEKKAHFSINISNKKNHLLNSIHLYNIIQIEKNILETDLQKILTEFSHKFTREYFSKSNFDILLLKCFFN